MPNDDAFRKILDRIPIHFRECYQNFKEIPLLIGVL